MIMENKGKFGFQLRIVKNVYFQDGQEFPVDTPYLNFEHNGNVSLNGADGIGTFSFSGRIEGDILYLKKSYLGAHTVHYVGKLEKNRVNLVYDFEGKYDELLNKLNSRDYMGLIEFDAVIYNLYLDGDHEKDYNVFLVKDDCKDKYIGLGLIKGILNKVIMKKKGNGKAKLKLKTPEDERSIKVTLDENTQNIYLERDQYFGNYALKVSRFVSKIEGNEYTSFLPHLYFKENAHCSNEVTDNNGPCIFKGHFENDIFFMEKSYPGKLSVYFAGKAENNRINLAYDFHGDYNNLRNQIINNNVMGFLELEHRAYNLVLNHDGGVKHFALLRPDGNKLKGFSIINNKLAIVVFKKKTQGKKTKLKIKTASKIMYFRAELDGSGNNITNLTKEVSTQWVWSSIQN